MKFHIKEASKFKTLTNFLKRFCVSLKEVRGRLFTLLICVFSITTQVNAQSTDPGEDSYEAQLIPDLTGANCINKHNDTIRLKCYDSAFFYKPKEVAKSGITAVDLAVNFGRNSTEAQRDAEWSKIEGKTASVTANVYDVDVPGWLEKKYKVTLKGPDGIDFYCRLPDRMKTEATLLRTGDKFTCTGSLTSYLFLFGEAAISIDHFGH
jgi:hypothetical protein